MTKKKINEITEAVGKNFRCFGGGKYTEGNPISIALAEQPYQFAAGVSVNDVVVFVLKMANRKSK